MPLDKLGKWLRETKALFEEIRQDLTHDSSPLYDQVLETDVYLLLDTEDKWLFGISKGSGEWKGIHPSLEVVYNRVKNSSREIRASREQREEWKKSFKRGVKEYGKLAERIDKKYELIKGVLPDIAREVSGLGLGVVGDYTKPKTEHLKKKIVKYRGSMDERERAFYNYHFLVDNVKYAVLVSRRYQRDLIPILKDLDAHYNKKEEISPFSFFMAFRDYSHMERVIDSVMVEEVDGHRVPSKTLVDLLSVLGREKRASTLETLSREFAFSF